MFLLIEFAFVGVFFTVGTKTCDETSNIYLFFNSIISAVLVNLGLTLERILLALAMDEYVNITGI